MCRIARRLFALCSAALLLLCIAACVLWARSRWTVDRLRVEYAGCSFMLSTSFDYVPTPGAISLEFGDDEQVGEFDVSYSSSPHADRPSMSLIWSNPPPPIQMHGGFGYQRRHFPQMGLFGSPARTVHVAVARLRPVAVAAAVLPAGWIAGRVARSLRRRRRHRQGCCPA